MNPDLSFFENTVDPDQMTLVFYSASESMLINETIQLNWVQFMINPLLHRLFLDHDFIFYV